LEVTDAPTASSAEAVGDSGKSRLADQAPAGGANASAARDAQATIIRNQQGALAEAMRMLAATESVAAPASLRNAAKPVEMLNSQPVGGQDMAGANMASYFTALKPVQPSLQTWLDNWLGPRARASNSTEDASGPTTFDEAGPPSSAQDALPFGLQTDIPDAQPAEALTPDEIAQSYADISLWLAANPGMEQEIAGASGSLQERNLFACIGAGCASDAGTISMPGFGASPGMSAIAGNSLQALHGIREGYTLLSAV
jgi:hypothetical protein